jgi:hypothetical protein
MVMGEMTKQLLDSMKNVGPTGGGIVVLYILYSSEKNGAKEKTSHASGEDGAANAMHSKS